MHLLMLMCYLIRWTYQISSRTSCHRPQAFALSKCIANLFIDNAQYIMLTLSFGYNDGGSWSWSTIGYENICCGGEGIFNYKNKTFWLKCHSAHISNCCSKWIRKASPKLYSVVTQNKIITYLPPICEKITCPFLGTPSIGVEMLAQIFTQLRHLK